MHEKIIYPTSRVCHSWSVATGEGEASLVQRKTKEDVRVRAAWPSYAHFSFCPAHVFGAEQYLQCAVSAASRLAGGYK